MAVFGRENKKAWDVVSSQAQDDQIKFRDVYEDQQLERSSIEGKQTATSRIVFSVVVAVLAAVVMWGFVSIGQMTIARFTQATSTAVVQTSSSADAEPGEYTPNDEYGYVGQRTNGSVVYAGYYQKQADGTLGEEVYETKAEVPVPDWWVEAKAAYEAEHAGDQSVMDGPGQSLGAAFCSFNVWKLLISLATGAVVFAAMYTVMMRNLQTQNMLNDTSDINQYHNDQHIALPEEVMAKFDWFPDVGAHASPQVSSMVSHVMLQNKGVKTVDVTKRAKEDVLDADGDIEYYAGEPVLDEHGRIVTETKPLFDEDFATSLFDASGLPKDKSMRLFYDATKIPYNKGNENRDKLKDYDTVADLINGDWVLPAYETQRPAGAYLVDTAPVNTLVLAITRAGKGQTIIEPTIDMWTRERDPNNMVVNDPKGELLQKFYVPATVRGFQVVQFNLINADNTDIYNPLILAATAAREGDFVQVSTYVNNVADVFFPVDGGEDPVWPNAANNAFKRAAFGIIDYYLEEEKSLRRIAMRTGMSNKVLENKLDALWGHATLYNCYQLFVQMTSKKMPNPLNEFEKRRKAKEFDNIPDEEYNELLDEAEAKAVFWEGKPEIDNLTLYFNATAALPRNRMRELVGNADNALRSMGAAEKMMASVYGIAITAMSFFTDPTIATLTSGAPSQNADLASLSFPRRLGFRIAPAYIEKLSLRGKLVRWSAFADENFTEDLGKDFYHQDRIDRSGWARYYFKGIFPNDVAYLRCQIVRPETSQVIKTFYFRFKKSYKTSLDGRRYMKDPILAEKIVQGGIMDELIRGKNKAGEIVFRPGHVTDARERMLDVDSMPHVEKLQEPVVTQFSLNYTEKPKAVFLVTPPHLMKYAKLLLILIKQLVDLNFDKSYMTKENQKPLYKTRYMLDELGNLQSDGHGIQNLETFLSIGLGQDQQFTLILQTLQQLTKIYGNDSDKILQGNTSNIIFLKSTDDAMIETLQKMSGTTHRVYKNSKTVTRDTEAIFSGLGGNEGKTSYTMTAQEEPVIKFNDMMYIAERNSIVFRAGDAPVWNRRQMILPMSWRLRQSTISHPGHTYSFQTIPTLSSAKEFKVERNMPDFNAMLAQRLQQALAVNDAKTLYMEMFGYTERDIETMDMDEYADAIMEIVNASIEGDSTDESGNVRSLDVDEYEALRQSMGEGVRADSQVNEEQIRVTRETQAAYDVASKARFAGGMLSPLDLYDPRMQGANHQYDRAIIDAYLEVRGDMERDDLFTVASTGLCGEDGVTPYIVQASASVSLAEANKAAKDPGSRVFADGELEETDVSKVGTFEVTNAFLKFLSEQTSWSFANGRFEQAMAQRMAV